MVGFSAGERLLVIDGGDYRGPVLAVLTCMISKCQGRIDDAGQDNIKESKQMLRW